MIESKKVDKIVDITDPNVQLMLRKPDMEPFLDIIRANKPGMALTRAGLFRCAVVALREKIGLMDDEEFRVFYSQHKKCMKPN